MVTKEIVIHCPLCGSDNVVKRGQRNGKQIYSCKNPDCPKKYFSESYKNKACDPNVSSQVLKMIANGNGTRATARIVGISPNTVTAICEKLPSRISHKGVYYASMP